MTAVAGSSEFGKPQWFLTLCRAFKNDPSEPGEFKLLQLALADVTDGVPACIEAGALR